MLSRRKLSVEGVHRYKPEVQITGQTGVVQRTVKALHMKHTRRHVTAIQQKNQNKKHPKQNHNTPKQDEMRMRCPENGKSVAHDAHSETRYSYDEMRMVQREWRTQFVAHEAHSETRYSYDEMRVVQREWRTQLEHKCITSVVQRTVKALHMMHTRRHVTAMTRCGWYRENGELNWNISNGKSVAHDAHSETRYSYDEMRVVQREWRTQLKHKCITSVVQRTVKALHMMHTRRHVTAMTRCGWYTENGELNWNISNGKSVAHDAHSETRYSYDEMRVVQIEWRTQLEHKCITSVVQRTVKAYDEMRVVQREWRTQLEHKCITSVVQRTVKALHMMHTRRHVTAMTRCGSYRENGELNWNISV
ncbi:hypothetical protein J6590_080241 [Homalodisca vitripennis]|nr:hypothetical protein J6590_080241 [Homalodisca vitripennis]